MDPRLLSGGTLPAPPCPARGARRPIPSVRILECSGRFGAWRRARSDGRALVTWRQAHSGGAVSGTWRQAHSGGAALGARRALVRRRACPDGGHLEVYGAWQQARWADGTPPANPPRPDGRTLGGWRRGAPGRAGHDRASRAPRADPARHALLRGHQRQPDVVPVEHADSLPDLLVHVFVRSPLLQLFCAHMHEKWRCACALSRDEALPYLKRRQYAPRETSERPRSPNFGPAGVLERGNHIHSPDSRAAQRD